MQFTTPAFFAFLLLFFVFWRFLYKRVQLRLVFLVIASLVFYSWADWRYIFLIAIIGAIGFWGGEAAAKDDTGRKKTLILSIAACLFFLLFFRYSLYFLGILLKILVRIGQDKFPDRYGPVFSTGYQGNTGPYRSGNLSCPISRGYHPAFH